MAGQNSYVTPNFLKTIMIHEYFMSVLMLQIIIRLIFTGKFNVLFFGYVFVLFAYCSLIYFGIITQSNWINRLRLFSNFILMDFVFSSVKYVVPSLGLGAVDEVLLHIDSKIVGTNLSLRAESLLSKVLTEIMSFGYLLHFVPFIIALIYFAFRSDFNKSYLFYSGMFCLIAVGFTGYTLVPAEGPYVYLKSQFTQQISGYFITKLNDAIVRLGTARFDVFPSLHTGVALYLLLFFRNINKKIFYLYLPLFAIIVCATIYLRYHYFIDVVCGAILSAVCYLVSRYSLKVISREKLGNF